MNIKPFGEINPNKLEEYYADELSINGTFIDVDLNFRSKTIDSEALTKVSKYLEQIESHIKKAFEVLSADFDRGESSEEALHYLEHHKEELSKEELIEIFGATEITKELFFKNLAVDRVGLYPEDDDSYAIIDIKLPDEYTDYILVVYFTSKGELSDIAMES